LARSSAWIAGAIFVLGAAHAHAVEHFTVGTSSRPWATWGEFDAIDGRASPGWIQPIRTSLDENILHELLVSGRLYPGEDPDDDTFRADQDGRIWSTNAPVGENRKLVMLADGLEDTLAFDYFNRVGSNSGVTFVADLGVPFPVSQISFFPLDFGLHLERFVQGYELHGNDGSPETLDEFGDPDFFLLSSVPTNNDVVVRNSRFTSRHLRYVKLRITHPAPFEIDQLEIRGEGYVRRSSFTSAVIDLEDLVNFGRVYWSAVDDPGAQALIQTRFGDDGTPLVYHRVEEGGVEYPLAGSTDGASLRLYEALPAQQRGSVTTDTQNWSSWSWPYPGSGHELARTGPSRFFQFRIVLETTLTESRSRIDSIAFEFSRPTMARKVGAEIQPREEVELGEEQEFTYVIQPEITAADIGYDIVELDMPSWARLHSVQLGGRDLTAASYEARTEKNLLSLRLLDPADRITASDDVLTLRFTSSMLIYGSVFGGRVLASWDEDLLPQPIEEQDVGDLEVFAAEASLGAVLRAPAAQPPVFTPNGDGVNDRTSITFRIAQMVGQAPLRVLIYDLSGRPVATVFDRPAESDSYALPWDGRDASGDLVPPGLYLYGILLDGDADDYRSTGLVAVTY